MAEISVVLLIKRSSRLCRSTLNRLLKLRHDQLLHRHECLGDTVHLFACSLSHHLSQLFGDDLPRDAVPVFEPSTLLRFRNGSEFLPILIDLLLVLTQNHQGDRFVELEVVILCAVHRCEPLPGYLEVCKHEISDRKSTRLNSSHVAISYA